MMHIRTHSTLYTDSPSSELKHTLFLVTYVSSNKYLNLTIMVLKLHCHYGLYYCPVYIYLLYFIDKKVQEFQS